MSKHLKHADDGHLVHSAAGHLVNDCQIVAAPCLCPGNLATSYAIVPNLLAACSTCDGGSCSSSEPWDGTFQLYSTCNWQGLNAAYTTWIAGQCFHIDQKNLSLMELKLDPYDCQWVLTINCFSPTNNNTLWHGVKTTGLTPAGIYSKILGCDGPAIMEVF